MFRMGQCSRGYFVQPALPLHPAARYNENIRNWDHIPPPPPLHHAIIVLIIQFEETQHSRNEIMKDEVV